ncbi:putative amidase-like protein 1 [Colletotrichum chlorophyti]|uniref:Putative amidase-like protein 1 n=1 Tax=Colletotrichum chlorophyti TaxID=708187 RepID=A0A1Q8S834_9PEZI|nr:putative amidase-like protein 1 [Colletotrichum chlorophyti]
MNNSADSYALVGAKVPEDSTVAAKLRSAGAIILGKAHMSQWADCRSTNSSAGWSTFGGQTRGAYYPDQVPSGSSSGSGVASSVGLAWASLGTDTFGSITLPTRTTVGPMARTVKDAAHLLTAVVGPNSNANYTSAIPFDETPNYADEIVGRNANYSISVFDSAVEVMRGAGAVIIDDIYLPGYSFLDIANLTNKVQGADFLANLPEYLSKLTCNPYNITTVSELQKWTQNDPREEWPGKNTETWDRVLENGIRNNDAVFWEYYSRNQYLAGPRGYAGALRNYSLDAIVLPTHFVLVAAAVLGTPVVTVPFGGARTTRRS